MRFDATRALIVYSGVLTAALGWTMLSAAAPAPATHFDTIDVHRINLTESDGTVRMIVASRDHFPGMILHGQETPQPNRTDSAGMIFFNDEGTENGGLIFGGRRGRDGKVVNFGHLSFDQYDQDQVVRMEQTEEDGERDAGITIADRPNTPVTPAFVASIEHKTDAERAAMRATGAFGHDRAFIGKQASGDSLVALRDGDGHVRLRMRVSKAGASAIEFLDAGGKVVRTVGS